MHNNKYTGHTDQFESTDYDKPYIEKHKILTLPCIIIDFSFLGGQMGFI